MRFMASPAARNQRDLLTKSLPWEAKGGWSFTVGPYENLSSLPQPTQSGLPKLCTSWSNRRCETLRPSLLGNGNEDVSQGGRSVSIHQENIIMARQATHGFWRVRQHVLQVGVTQSIWKPGRRTTHPGIDSLLARVPDSQMGAYGASMKTEVLFIP
jgi:hypothetical protein